MDPVFQAGVDPIKSFLVLMADAFQGGAQPSEPGDVLGYVLLHRTWGQKEIGVVAADMLIGNY